MPSSGRSFATRSVALSRSAPLGALLSGFLADAVGPLGACWVCAVSMTALAAGASLFTGTARLE